MKRFLANAIELLPGVAAARARGFATIFVAFFYLCLFILLYKYERLASMARSHSAEDRLSVAAVVAALLLFYLAGALVPYLQRRYEKKGSRLARRFAANRTAVTGLVLIMVFLFIAVLGPFLAPYDPAYQPGKSFGRYEKPSVAHPMGTDKFGRDVLSRVIYGARVSLSIGVLAVILSSIVGVVFGALGGYLGGFADEALMRLADGLLAFPRLLLVLLLVALFTNTFALIVLAIAFTSWMGTARLVRAAILSLKEREFIEAALATGVHQARIIWRHLLPNSLSQVIVAATLQIGGVILLESTLSFLGIGVQPATATWGGMVFEGREVLGTAWWVSAFPGMAIAMAVISCNLLGDGIRDALEAK